MEKEKVNPGAGNVVEEPPATEKPPQVEPAKVKLSTGEEFSEEEILGWKTGLEENKRNYKRLERKFQKTSQERAALERDRSEIPKKEEEPFSPDNLFGEDTTNRKMEERIAKLEKELEGRDEERESNKTEKYITSFVDDTISANRFKKDFPYLDKNILVSTIISPKYLEPLTSSLGEGDEEEAAEIIYDAAKIANAIVEQEVQKRLKMVRKGAIPSRGSTPPPSGAVGKAKSEILKKSPQERANIIRTFLNNLKGG